MDPIPPTEVKLVEQGDDDVPSGFEVCFLFDRNDPRSASAAIAAQTRCLELFNADPTLAVTEGSSADNLFGIAVWNCPKAQYDRHGQPPVVDPFPELAEAHRNNAPPHPEDADLATALDPLAGPIEVQLPRQPLLRQVLAQLNPDGQSARLGTAPTTAPA